MLGLARALRAAEDALTCVPRRNFWASELGAEHLVEGPLKALDLRTSGRRQPQNHACSEDFNNFGALPETRPVYQRRRHVFGDRGVDVRELVEAEEPEAEGLEPAQPPPK